MIVIKLVFLHASLLVTLLDNAELWYACMTVKVLHHSTSAVSNIHR